MISIEDLEDLRFEKLAFRQRIYEKSDEFGVLRFEKLAFRQRIYEISDEFGVLRFGKFAFGRLRSKIGIQSKNL